MNSERTRVARTRDPRDFVFAMGIMLASKGHISIDGIKEATEHIQSDGIAYLADLERLVKRAATRDQEDVLSVLHDLDEISEHREAAPWLSAIISPVKFDAHSPMNNV